jgi:hypothetical protein
LFTGWSRGLYRRGLDFVSGQRNSSWVIPEALLQQNNDQLYSLSKTALKSIF